MALFRCQACHQPLEFSGNAESFVSTAQVAATAAGGASIFGAAPGRLDESFVVLDDNNRSPAQRRGLGGPLSVVNPGDKLNDLPNASCVPSPERGSSNNMDESFVVLPQGSGNGHHAGSPGHNQFFATLSRIFDVASRGSQVDHPVCLECMKQIRQQVDKQIEEVEREVQCYEQCLVELGEEAEEEGITDREFESEMTQLAQKERRERARLKEIEALQAQADREMLALETEGKELAALEGKYWQEFNEFHFHLQAHQEEAASVLAKIESTCEVLELLRHTNVYNDAFHIWHAGPFGTINNFRLGRLPTVNVEWDEINAAWGQACLLLHTMAQACKFKFSSYKILPLGSHPRIADSKNTYELYGPVNPFWSARYDKAMVCFLACLQEFADFAKGQDRAKKHSPEFELPYKLEADKIDGKTIKYSFNRDDKWTAALKLMLSDLKVALSWLTDRGMPA